MAGTTIASNMFFINAPAGSGKTHFIKDKINNILDKTPSATILCITYTERAAQELKRRILSSDVFISTIHSFINYFISPYFKHKETIELYYELYKSDVEKRILDNKGLHENDIDNRNYQYCIKKGLNPSTELTLDIIKENTTSIYYNEHKYNSLYYGGLSHDNLLEFAFLFLEKYPVLQLRLKEMFKYIFVDEVQDTDAKILRLFYNSVKDTSSELYYFGDKMQEIYNNYDGSFENELKTFNCSLSQEFRNNYRSSEEIVILLNALYGRKKDEQQHSISGKNGIYPKLIICKSFEDYCNNNQVSLNDFLVLRISNKSRFSRENPDETMGNIFEQMSLIYPQGSKITPVEAMLSLKNESSPDILMRFFYELGQMKSAYDELHFAEIIQSFNDLTFIDLEGKRRKVFHSNMAISEHKDKTRIHKVLSKAFERYNSKEAYTLSSYLHYLTEIKMVNPDFENQILQTENDEGKPLYSSLLECDFQEMKRLIIYKDNQTISTQHGVKGEGHSKVCFWSEDSRQYRPYVYMYDFFQMYSEIDSFSLKTFQEFYYDFYNIVAFIEKKLCKKISDIKSGVVTEDNIDLFDKALQQFRENIYFNYIYKEDIVKYLESRSKGKLPTLKSIQNIFKVSTANRILIAYKLFYVGCSRAKDELVVLVAKDKVSAFEDKFKIKMTKIGFVLE